VQSLRLSHEVADVLVQGEGGLQPRLGVLVPAQPERGAGQLPVGHGLAGLVAGLLRGGDRDLLRTYAAELVWSAEPDDQRQRALHRLVDYYLHTAWTAARLLQPQWQPITPVPRLPDSFAVPIADRDVALDWFAAEHHALLRVVLQAADTGFEAYASQLAWAVTAFLAPRGLWQDQFTV